MQSETVTTDPAGSPPWRRILRLRTNTDFLVFTSLFIITFAPHATTAARTVTFSDSGDFLMGLTTVGNVHGPGYPLYLMTAKLFSWFVPLGTLAFRASLYSAVFASLTTCLVYWIVYRMTHSRVAGVAAGLAYAFSYTFWYQTVIPETYSLNAFFIALLIVLIMRWERQLREGNRPGADNTLCVFSLVFGFALANHFSIIFLLPAFLFFAADTDWREAFAPRNLLRMAAFLTIGLLPYIYEPAAAFRGPAYNYGDPSTLIRWYHQITVYYQRGGLFKYPLLLLPGRFWRYFGTLTTEFPYFWWLGGIGFLASLKKRNKKYPLFLLLLFLLTILPVMTYQQTESVLRAHFYYESYLLFVVWIGLGVACLLKALESVSFRTDRLVQHAALILAAVLVMLCPLSAAVIHYDKVDKSNYYFARDMARDMLETVERGAVLVVSHDNVIFPVMYMQIAEGLRDDVNVVSTVAVGVPGFGGTNLLEYTPPGYAAKSGSDNYSQIVERNSERLPVYTTIADVIRHNLVFNWLGFVVRVKSGGAGPLPSETSGPLRLPGSYSKRFKDSDARWAIFTPEALRAMVLYSEKDYRGAQTEYGDIIPRFQKDIYVPTLYSCWDFSEYYEFWGQVLNAQNKYRDTVNNLPNCRVIDPDFISISLARAYAALGDLSSAIVEYNRYITSYPGDSISYTELGEIYLRLEDYPNAERELKRAVSRSSTGLTHALYGRVLMLQGRDSEARKELEEAIRLDPTGQYGEFARETLKQLRP